MAKIGCGLLGEYTHEDHHCKECAYFLKKETEYPCDTCFEVKLCFWVPAL